MKNDESPAPKERGEAGMKQMPVGVCFQPGSPGRPKGSRNKLGEHFIANVYADWQPHDIGSLLRVARGGR